MLQVAARGLVSVMPHAWRMGRPVVSRNPSESDLETAEPPQMTDRNDEVSRPTSSGSTPIQMVGTPAAMVTDSLSMRPASAPGDRSAPGMTRVAPVATPAWASPQALAWNIGTTGRITSRSQAPRVSAIIVPKVWSTIDRWE